MSTTHAPVGRLHPEPWPGSRRATRRPRMTDEPGVRFGIAHAALVAATLVAAAAGLDPTLALGLLLLVAAAAGLGLSAGWTTGLAVSAWAFTTGFVEHGYGVLTLHAPDVERMGVALAVGLVVALVPVRAGARRG